MHLDREEKQNLLHVFNLITTKGHKTESVYELSGIRASYDFDGYTCWLAYRDLTVTLMFHGSYDFEYQHKETLEFFFKMVSNLLAEKDNL
ncbi:conserved hypothetical protein [Psychromonas ingrahamii 37]|uniref:DUF3081 domain-containing protein n=1 Tax=Psychromonas ingrahamii (strain DSM 17664 / CCUG 51855 / 37) TaxID=357804 RepID=A1SXN7_PSYIN|nr:DUF3081 domain-containing protein [Psychromonas ingrahamii]ABM04252.1 conserved hypothetical protein [Psychromonas ingrahamii 37]